MNIFKAAVFILFALFMSLRASNAWGARLAKADDLVIGNGIWVREAGSDLPGACTWDNPGSDINDNARHDSPTIYGFNLSETWRDYDYADFERRFRKEFNWFLLHTPIAYSFELYNGDSCP